MSAAVVVPAGWQRRSERELCAAAGVVVRDAGGRMGWDGGWQWGSGAPFSPVLNGGSVAESRVRTVGGRRQQKEVRGRHLLQAAHDLGQAGQVVPKK